MERNPDNIISVNGDTILVKKLEGTGRAGRFYVPENHASTKCSWRAEILLLGKEVNYDELKIKVGKGDIVYIDPVALQCPGFFWQETEYRLIKDDDLLAVEEKESVNV